MPADQPVDDEQLSLLPSPVPSAAPPAGRRAAARAAVVEPAPTLPIARVAVDTGVAHLDRPFDYLVPAVLHDDAVVGARVRVRFAGRLVDGFVLDRVSHTDHEGRLAPLAKVVSREAVLTPEVLALARAVADRYAGALADVLRLAIPPRHATAERAARPSAPSDPVPAPRAASWARYPGADQWLAALATGAAPRVAWAALASEHPAELVAQAVAAMLVAGRGSLVCVPDVRDVEHWDRTFAEVLGPGRHVVLTAAQSPAQRWRAFLTLARGDVQVVLGTRAAAYAPVQQLGLVALWDDGDDLYAEPRAPYPHAREVLLVRATLESTAVLLGGFARTAEVQSLVESGWCGELIAERADRRALWPRVDLADGSEAGAAPVRLPRAVFTAVRAATGPVLVQVPRRGYRSGLSCQRCRASARCEQCEGPLQQPGPGRPPQCRWCGTAVPQWACRACGAATLRAPVVGALRTAEEFGRAFAGRPVVTSGGHQVLASLDDPAPGTIVLATPGAEPWVAGGYALVVLLDTGLMLARDDMRVGEESHRRWFNALALARPGAAAVAVGESAALQALVRADPVGVAERELADRRATHLPPVGRLATIDAESDVIATLLRRAWPPHTEVLGPVPSPVSGQAGVELERLILRSPRRDGAALAAALRQVVAERSAAKASLPRVQIDPAQF